MKTQMIKHWRFSPLRFKEGEPEHPALPDFDDSTWLRCSAPGTILGALVEAGQYLDIFVDDNLDRIEKEQFSGPWWFRTVIPWPGDEELPYADLCFDGINYSANIWLNGEVLAHESEVSGAFRRFRFDVSDVLREGENMLALEVTGPHPGDYSTGFVDWNPAPPDGNLGLFRPVCIQRHGPLSIRDACVYSDVDADQTEASLSVHLRVTNHSDTDLEYTLELDTNGQQTTKQLRIKAGESELVTVGGETEDGLKISNPHLWWPYTMGSPDLYEMQFRVELAGQVSDAENVCFGIRTVEDYFTPEGHRGFIINGQKLLILGAGWTDDLFLRDTEESIDAQLEYVRHMGLNTVRLEGIWGTDQTLYDLCDRKGILLMVGWSCHWEHEDYLGVEADDRFGGAVSEADIDLLAQSWEDQVLWLRHHPSIFTWAVGSDKMPVLELERRYVDTFDTYDRSRPYLISTAGFLSDEGIITESKIESEISGQSGMKMLGPYDHTPPAYWYTDQRRGGAYGFNTETGPGAQPPPRESIERMLSPEHRWPIDDCWDFHCARMEFNTLDRFVEAMTERLGPPEDPADFDRKAQLLNYELIRPMFESFRVRAGKTTGLIHWMLNSAWPSFYWQLYDWYLLPNAAFYATRKACRPVHLIYDYGDRVVTGVNSSRAAVRGARCAMCLFDTAMDEIWKSENTVEMTAGQIEVLARVPAFDDGVRGGLLSLRLFDDRQDLIDDSMYWLSAKPDVLDYEAFVESWPYHTPTGSFADLLWMDDLLVADVDVQWDVKEQGDGIKGEVMLKNTSATVALVVELRIIDQQGGSLVPVFWDDNYISLLPGEQRILRVRAHGAGSPEVVMKGWNVRERKIN